MKEEINKAIVGRWFTELWGPTWNPAIVDELAAPDMLLQYSLHEPREETSSKQVARRWCRICPLIGLLLRDGSRKACQIGAQGSSVWGGHRW